MELVVVEIVVVRGTKVVILSLSLMERMVLDLVVVLVIAAHLNLQVTVGMGYVLSDILMLINNYK